jgi:glycosyltransferase involved in cell wall biosynthesis
MVVPLRFGAGMKGKIGSALEEGLPVVTTSVGAEGMDLVHGKHVLIGDDPASIASAIADLCWDDELWSRLSQAGQDHLATRFSFDAIGPVLDRLLTGHDRA